MSKEINKYNESKNSKLIKEIYEHLQKQNRKERRRFLFKKNRDTDVDRISQKSFLLKSWNADLQLPFKGKYKEKQIKIAIDFANEREKNEKRIENNK